MATGSEDMLKGALSGSLDSDISRFKRIFHSDLNSDVHFRLFRLYGNRICLIYIEGMADERRIGEFVLRACADAEAPGLDTRDASDIRERVIEMAQCDPEGRVEAIVNSVATGMTAMLIDGSPEALLMETRGFPARPVGHTMNESVVIGAQEGFVESLRTNMTLLRRYAPSHRLVTEMMTVGTEVPCRVTLAYLDGVALPGTIERLREHVNRVQVRAVRGIGELQQLIEDRPVKTVRGQPGIRYIEHAVLTRIQPAAELSQDRRLSCTAVACQYCKEMSFGDKLHPAEHL